MIPIERAGQSPSVEKSARWATDFGQGGMALRRCDESHRPSLARQVLCGKPRPERTPRTRKRRPKREQISRSGRFCGDFCPFLWRFLSGDCVDQVEDESKRTAVRFAGGRSEAESNEVRDGGRVAQPPPKPPSEAAGTRSRPGLRPGEDSGQ